MSVVEVVNKNGYKIFSVAGRDEARHTSPLWATVASHTVSRRAIAAKQSTVNLAMPSPIVATCVKVCHLAPHFSHILLASGEPNNSMDGLLSHILGKTYQLSSSCPHSTFFHHFFFENMLSLTR